MGKGRGAAARTRPRVFEATELGARSAEVLAAARKGEVTLRSPAGPELVILSRQRIDALKGITRAALNLATIEAVLAQAQPGLPLDWQAMEDWPWVKVLTTDDVQEFVQELRAAIAQARNCEDARPIEEVVNGWRLSAEILSDPIGREIFYGPRTDDDFIEVSRPE